MSKSFTVGKPPTDLPTISISDEEEIENITDIKGMSFTVTLNKKSNKNVKVDYETVKDTADISIDFTPTSGTLTIPVGELIGTINVPIINDEFVEGDETFKVILSNPFNATIEDKEGIGTILDDENGQGPTKTQDSNKGVAKGLRGRLLLNVDQGGEIWYVDHQKGKRHNVKWDNALPLFEEFAIGITDANLLKIPAKLETINPELDTDGDGHLDVKELERGYSPYDPNPVKFELDLNFANGLKGNFLLQVERGGAIWYVDQDGYRYNVRWDNLKSLFESLALGITNSDLNKIPI